MKNITNKVAKQINFKVLSPEEKSIIKLDQQLVVLKYLLGFLMFTFVLIATEII